MFFSILVCLRVFFYFFFYLPFFTSFCSLSYFLYFSFAFPSLFPVPLIFKTFFFLAVGRNSSCLMYVHCSTISECN